MEYIAKQLCVSTSTLAHKSRSELNISVYKYIAKKRHSVALNPTENGERLINVSLKSGI